MGLSLSAFGYGGKKRTFATYTPDLVIEETAEDNTTITEHPIEDGSVITDHVIFNPITVTLDCYWGPAGLMGMEPNEVYSQVLAFQRTAQPFNITLGKRTLENMLLKSVRYNSNKDTEYVLHLSLDFQQIIRAELKEVTIKTPAGEHASTVQQGKQSASSENNAAKAGGASAAAQKNSSALYNLVLG